MARFIDGILLQAVQLVFGLVVGFTAGAVKSDGATTALGVSLFVFGMAVAIGYETIMVGKYGATLGKMAVGLKIVRADGGRVSMGLAAGRHFAQLLSAMILGIGYIMAAFDKEKRTLHDHICSTRVIKTR